MNYPTHDEVMRQYRIKKKMREARERVEKMLPKNIQEKPSSGKNDTKSSTRKYKYYEPTVKLVSYTQIDEDYHVDVSDVKELIAYIAKVSNPKYQDQLENSDRLINYLMEHKHWSPFQMIDVTLEIDPTRDIGRQILRHRSFEFQEFSQRYADIDQMDIQFVMREARLQDKKNRQNSIKTDDQGIITEWHSIQSEVVDECYKRYLRALEMGIAKEQARALLPEGLTMSRMYMKGSIRSWIHYISLRSGNGTQQEHIEVAKACAKAISKIFPMEEYVQPDPVPVVVEKEEKNWFWRWMDNIAEARNQRGFTT